MADLTNRAKRQVVLRMTNKATESAIVDELISTLEKITAHGTITDSGVAELREWLEKNRDAQLPAVDFLRTALDKVPLNGGVAVQERKALYVAVERVLPSGLRKQAKQRRLASGLSERDRKREAKVVSRARAAEEREKNQPVYSANFMLKGLVLSGGVVHQRRKEAVEQYLQGKPRVGRNVKTGLAWSVWTDPGPQTVFLVRDPKNPKDKNAVEVFVKEGYQIGFVPREHAQEMAPLMDAGCKQQACCTKLLDGRLAPIPVVQVYLYRADATNVGAVSSNEVTESLPDPRSCETETAPVGQLDDDARRSWVSRPTSVNFVLLLFFLAIIIAGLIVVLSSEREPNTRLPQEQQERPQE